MIKTMNESVKSAIYDVADLMTAAALTAPKTSGQDKIVTLIIDGEDKFELSKHMLDIAEETGREFIKRDAFNIGMSQCVVLIGVRREPYGMDPCGLCGHKNCGELVKSGGNCVFNITDLGIATGSAASVAADHRIDNRVMYSVGVGAIRMKCFPDDVIYAYGIPLSANTKSIFYDRDPEAIMNAK